jgi:uncharacterized membrane protein
LKDSKNVQKVFFYLGVICVILAALGGLSYGLRFLLKPSDWILVAIVFMLLSLDAKSGSTFMK